MPAAISQVNGHTEMMYVGATPWHGLGVKLDNPATAEEAIQAAHLDWEVVQRPVFLERREDHPDRTELVFERIEGRQAVQRVDTGEVFGVFSDGYTLLQNRDAFKFFDGVVGEGQAIYHTAGALAGGKRIWMLAKLPGELKVTNRDVLEKYVLLANSHDGSLAVHMKLTPIRVVCQNTLFAALEGGRHAQEFYTVHRGGLQSRLVEAREVLGLSDAYFARVMEGVEALVNKPMSQTTLDLFLWDI